MLNTVEQQQVKEFLQEKFLINDMAGWDYLVDWLREIYRGNKDFFLSKLPENEYEYRLLYRMCKNDVTLRSLLDNANVLVHRKFLIDMNSNSYFLRTKCTRDAVDCIISIVQRVQTLIGASCQ